MPKFPRGNEFPYEGFVQQAIEAYFASQGNELLEEGFTDLVCRHPDTGHRWIVETKGNSSSVGMDFNTRMGQILKQRALTLHWLLVDDSGVVRVLGPEELTILE